MLVSTNARMDSDECRPFSFTQPPFCPIIEPTEKTGKPFPTAQSRNSKETTTLKSEVIQTTTKPILGDSTSLAVIYAIPILVLLIGIGIIVWQWRRSNQNDPKHHSNFHNRMAEPKEILYRNWIKAGLGLLYVKEGIQDFIVDEINNFHSSVLGTLPGAGRCTIHTIQNVLRCPTQGICSGRPCRFHDITDPVKTYIPCPICEAIRNEIELAHRYVKPSYKNTRSEQWCTASWELAKCFMSASGYVNKNTADDTDLSGLISVILNNKAFQNKITENLRQPENKFEKVRTARNDIMHNANMETPTADLNSYFNILNDVLKDSKHLQHLTKVKDAKDKLHQLQNNLITITTADEQMVREESLKALERKKEECIDEIDNTTLKNIEKLQKIVTTKTDEGVQVLEEKTQAGLCQINEAVNRQQEKSEHMHMPADKEYKNKTDDNDEAKEPFIKKEDKFEVHICITNEDYTPDMDREDPARLPILLKIEIAMMNRLSNTSTVSVKVTGCSQGSLIVIFLITTENLSSPSDLEKSIKALLEGGTIGEFSVSLEKFKFKRYTDAGTSVDSASEENENPTVGEPKPVKTVVKKEQKESSLETDAGTSVDSASEEYENPTVGEPKPVKTVVKKEEESEQKESSLETASEEYENPTVGEPKPVKTVVKKEEESEQKESSLETASEEYENPTVGEPKPVKTVVKKEEESEQKESSLETDLKEEIVDHYMCNGYCLCIPGLVDGDETLVDDFFVMPEMKRVKPATIESNVNTNSIDSISSIHGLFLKDKQRIRNVCIVGEAGRGKTTLCQKIISSWCTIHKNKETATYSEPANTSIDNDDEQFLKSFKFLFYIPLRNHKKSNVVEMIEDDLVIKGKHYLLNEILVKESESCLVILDGLDEWVPEKSYTGTLPYLDPREKFSVMITTRPWKLEVLRPRQPDIGQAIELNGISFMYRHVFVENVIKVLDRIMHKKDKTSDSFFEYIRLNMIENLIGVPLLLTQIICMWWYDDIECGYTQTEIYCEMIEYLFNVADRRQQMSYQTVIPDSQVSIKRGSVHSLHIFKGRTHCQKYGQILVDLSELAYCTLFNENRENALVFKHSLSKIHNLTENDVQFCLKVGLLSQAKYVGRFTPSKKLSFLHKTFQDFLAAMYIANFDDDRRLTSMLQTFKCFNDVHEMAQVLIFLSGMRPDFVVAMSRQIAELADKDERVLNGRQTLGFQLNLLLLNEWKSIESVLFDCLNEGYRDGRFPDGLVMHDVNLSSTGVFKGDVKSLLQCMNTTKIKSICVDSEMLKDIDGQNVVKLFVENASSQGHVNDLTSFIKDCFPPLTCLHVGGRLSQDPYVNMGDLIPSIHTLNHITCIGLEIIELSHSNIERLSKYLSGNTQLKEIFLNLIRCISCKQNQCIYKIELFRHKTLNSLKLVNLKGLVRLGQFIPLTTCKLENANIGLSVVECLKSSPSLQDLTLDTSDLSLFMEESSFIYSVYQMMLSVVLPTLKNLRCLELTHLDCRQELLNFSQMTSLEMVKLFRLTMTLECVQCLVDNLPQTKNESHIYMKFITINPKHDLYSARQYILNNSGIFEYILPNLKEAICVGDLDTETYFSLGLRKK